MLVGFASTDVVLWKAAGAKACATGKFANLRRFTTNRFNEPEDWFAEMETRLSDGSAKPRDLVREAEKNGQVLEDNDVFIGGTHQ